MVTTLCLWAEPSGRICTLSPECFQQWDAFDLPENPPAHEQTRAHGIDAAGFLPTPLWAWLSEYFNARPISLLLDRSLPAGWHTLAWEQLNWRGVKLGTRLSVCRYAAATASYPHATGNTLIWDQWEGPQFDPLRARHHVERRFKRNQIDQDLQTGRDIGHFARLIILAHGGPSDATLLLDKSGNPWQIELPATLPPEVYVIACASYDGNLHAFATACLERGAKTVICGHGKLDAVRMNAALLALLDAEQSPDQTLRDLQRQDGLRQAGGVHWLRYYGAVPLAPYDRLTLAFYQQSIGDNPFTNLSRQLEKEGPEAIKNFLHTAQKTAEACWPLTQYWLLPLAAYWAEKHDHAVMLRLKSQPPPTIGHEGLQAAKAYGLAALYRRGGEYPKAVEQLAEGLQGDPQPQQEIDLLGALLNDLIDLNLPDAGQAVLDRLTQRLGQIDNPAQAFRLLDRRARLSLRQGRIDAALNDFKRKRLQSGDGQSPRELAGLLYAAAWFRHDDARMLAEEALAMRPQATAVGGGNDDHTYLLRALALWQWRCRGQADGVQAFLPECKKRLATLQDPGPFAAILIYDSLRRQDCAGAVWDEAIHALEHGRYWLELTAFHALAGQRQQAVRTLQNFQHKDMRGSAITALQSWTLDGCDWEKICRERCQQENDLFLADDFEPEKMLCLGMLPL